MSAYHERMPVIIPPELQKTWLNSRQEKELISLLKTYDHLTAHPVSKAVNKGENESPELIKPL